ncbi:CHAT domain-containing tetratricopeptide repeat protein [Planktothricoides raciborskii]|uniref:CHAT domain-containing tetratricopeptide repeat protein n=1 Tax=Planktothricoides raciborskii GIHE-MW2 TaxID=2792601 RepID=A0AAU8J7M0_9CYAN
MDEQRSQAYLNLIQELLDCPRGEVNPILKREREQIDAGFLQQCGLVAEQLQEAGQEKQAQFLRDLAQQLGEYVKNQSSGMSNSASQPKAVWDEYHRFLMQVLQATSKSGGNPQVVYPILQQNLDKLDLNLAQILRAWASQYFSKSDKTQAIRVAADIGQFASLIQNFSLGNRSNNLEIAISGYEIIATVFTQENDAKMWAINQANLGSVYIKRIQGERADNLEKAIAAYQAALEVYTWESYPDKCAENQLNLGVVYNNRMRGEWKHNLEVASSYYQAALGFYTRESYPEKWENINQVLQEVNNNRSFIFLMEVLQATQQSLGDPSIVYPILEQNLEKIDLNLAEILKNWAAKTFSEFTDNQASSSVIPGYIVILANLLQNFSLGNRSDNLEIAIIAYESALKVYTREAVPQDWAMIQSNLGLAYYNRIKGERADNLEKALAHYSEAAQIRRRLRLEKDLADTLDNVGNAHFNQAELGINPAANLDQALAHYSEAAQIRRRLRLEKDLAGTLNNLGLTHWNQAELGINPAANLDQALAHYSEAAQIMRRLGLEKDLAGTLNNLGLAYQTQAKLGINPAANLDQALVHHSEAAQIRRRLGLEKNLASTLNNLGNAYQTQAKLGINPATNLDQALAHYSEAAQIMRRLGLEKYLAGTLDNLGNTHFNQAELGINPAANLDQALAHYSKAAQIRRHLGLEKDLATTLTNLGDGYQTQAKLGINPAANLDQALAHYSEAAQIRRHLGLEKDLAPTLTNLGLAHWNQAELGINPAANLEQALVHHSEAAQICRRLGLEKALAGTLNNLGLAHLIQAELGINPAANLEQALVHYSEAAQIRRRLGLKKDLAGTLDNLGNAYRTQAELGNPAANLDQALAQYNEAAQIRRRLELEKDLATTLTNLGNARWTQSKLGINPVANLDQALAHYNEAAQIRRHLRLEKDLAATLNNLGVARWTQAELGINPAANLEQALAHYSESAQIRRRLKLEKDLAGTLSNFGLAYKAQSRLSGNSSSQKQKALENASGSFQDALEQVEYLRGEIGADSEGYKRNFNEQWNKVYLGMVEVCLELGRYQDAIEYADRSKARNLTELIATRDMYPSGEIPAERRQRLQELRQAISEEDRRLKQDPNPDYTYITQLREEFQAKYPYKPLKFSDIQSLLDDETVILEWYVLDDKFLTFTLTNQTLHLWTSSPEDRQNLINWTNTYINDYRRLKSDQWREVLPQHLEQLPKILHLDEILQNLFKNFPNCKKLILIPHRFLHLFPLHALPVATGEGEGQFLQDLFPKGVAYAPNCQVLQQAQNRQRPHFNRLFAIQNPTQDLHFTDMEVEAIQSLFNSHQVLKHDEAEKAAIDGETLKNAHCTHFSCHGYFNFQDALKSALILAKSEFTPPPPTDDPSRYLPLKDNKLLDLQKCLTLEDILRLDLTNCRLVTLSACETGITDFTSTSDEYIGLPSGFILAGSPNVVSTLWAVADISTAIFMIQFYQTLQQSDLSVVLALRQTQTWLREATVQDLLNWVDSCTVISPKRREEMKEIIDSYPMDYQPFESPYYWAPFCAIGQ